MEQNYLWQIRHKFALLLFLVSAMSLWAGIENEDDKTRNLTFKAFSSENTLEESETTCGSIDGFYIYDQATDMPVFGPIQNNAHIDIAHLPNNYYLVAKTSGYVESVTWLISGHPLVTENLELYTFPAGGTNWNAGVGSYSFVVKAYNQDNGHGTTCDTDPLSFSIVQSGGGVTAPSNPTCDSGAFLWQNNIDVTNLQGSSGIPQADLRFVDFGTTRFTIPGPYPTEFNGAVTVSLDEVVSWDGYTNRPNVGAQTKEKWKVVFRKNGNTVFESSYTQDVADNVTSGEWVGALESDIFLPQGTDEIIIVHIEDSLYGDGSIHSSPNSVVPSSICLSYEVEAIEPPSDPTCDDGAFLWQNSVDVTNLSGSFGIPQADLRFVDGSTTQFTIPGPYPSEFNDAVIVSLDEVISWDGYLNRANVNAQTKEKWKVIFRKNGNTVFESSYTQDVTDETISGEWIGALESDILLPQGTDEIILVHIEDSQFGAGSFNSPNSVVPSSVCISYEALPASLGDTVFLDEDQDGIQDPNEDGVQGVTVNLLDCNENFIATTTTDANGNYAFTDLDPNVNYIVQFIAPNGFEISPANQGGNDANDSDSNANGLT
ncbi:MAG: SdrD B-like domain-containing protein, partial [Winogradskyella sp.]|uniref:SdrD B-like domain-containing protein n=1 Tax=Winogradskyella sp. TaxID=1883156 RepID=UPI00385E0464